MFNNAEIQKEKYELNQTYEQEVQAWKEYIDDICPILFDQKPLHVIHLAHFDRSLLFGFTNREHILQVLKEVKPVDGLDMLSIEQILHPPEYVFGTERFVIDSQNYISSAPMQYLSNFDAYKLTRDANLILEGASKEDYDTSMPGRQFKRYQHRGRVYQADEYLCLLREATLMRNFTTKYSSSRRLLPIQKLIQIVVETSNFPLRGFPWKHNPILYALQRLYAPYRDFPFREVDLETTFLESASMILPELSFALVELWLKYLVVDMTREELLLGINVLLEWGTTSLDARLLAFKDSRVNVQKVLVEAAVSITGITHGYRNISGIVTESEPMEIWTDEVREEAPEFKSYQSEFMETCPRALKSYLEQIGLINNSAFTRKRVLGGLEEVRRLYVMINVTCQHGLFIKNPVILTMEKSILPRASIAVVAPGTTLMHNPGIYSAKLPLFLQWDETPVFREMLYEGRKLIAHYRDRYDSLDLHSEYIKALTNNSGGVDYQPTAEESVQIPESVLRAFGKKRLMYFLLNPILYESYSAWIGALKSVTNSGERKQVDRRGRVIQMVSNAAQLGPFLLFLWVDIMGKKEIELSSKKNTGTISDINTLLRTTADVYSVQESADISGMDASTTRLATSFINGLTVELLNQCSHESYFFARQADWTISKRTKDGEEYVGVKRIHPGIPVLQISEAIGESYNYKLSVPELNAFGLKVTVDTSPHVFPSGKFSTNAQHSLLNTLVLRVLHRRLLSLSLEKRIAFFGLEVRVSGDDLYVSFRLQKRDDDSSRTFSAELVRIFNQIGFKIGSLLSRYSATFLQQAAIFGTVLPKPDRLALTTSERGESLKLGVFEGFSEFRDIVKELCGRVHFPSNTKGILVAVANQLRRVRIDTKRAGKEVVEGLRQTREAMRARDERFCELNNLPPKSTPYRLVIGTAFLHLILPFFSIFTSDGFEVPSFATCHFRYVERSNIFTPRGTVNDWKLRKMLLKPGLSMTSFVTPPAILQLLGDDLMEGTSSPKTLARVRRSKAQIEDVVRQHVRALYDDDLASFLGLDWLRQFTTFNVKEVLERMRLSQFPKHVRDEWAERLKIRLNFDAIVRSKLAGLKLEMAGYKLSKRLAFYNSPVERINQAITSGGDTIAEFKVHRLELLFHMAEFRLGAEWRRNVEYEAVMLCDYGLTSFSIPIERDYIADLHGGLMLSSGRDLDRDIVLYKFGHNFYDLSVQFSGYYALTPGPFKDYKHEELVRFAAQVSHERPDLLNLVWEFANIPARYRIELEQIINFGETGDLNAWRSIIHKRQSFELSGGIRHVPKLWEVTETLDGRVNRMLLTIMRDIGIACNAIFTNKARLGFSPAMLLIHGGIRSKLNSLLALRLKSSRA